MIRIIKILLLCIFCIHVQAQCILIECSSSDETCLGLNDGTVTAVDCNDCIEYSIDGGMTWQSSSLFMNMAPADYTITGRDMNMITCECEEVIVAEGPEPEDPIFTFITEYCDGGDVEVLPPMSDCGISGTWSPSEIDNENSGVYTFTPDDGQCANVVEVNVEIYDNPEPQILGDAVFCSGSPITLSTQMSYDTYDWSGPAGFNSNEETIVVSVSGTYEVIVTFSGCIGTSSVLVSEIPLPDVIDVTPSIPQICNDNDMVHFVFTGTPGATVTYEISGGLTMGDSILLGPDGTATTETYSAEPSATQIELKINNVMGVNGCNNLTPTVNLPINVPVVNDLAAVISGQDKIACDGANQFFTIIGTPSATVTYSLNNIEQTGVISNNGDLLLLNISETTTLSLMELAIGDCRSIIENQEQTITFVPLPSVESVTNDGPHCAGERGNFYIQGTAGSIINYRISSGGSFDRPVPGNGILEIPTFNQTSLTVVDIRLSSDSTCKRDVNQSSTIEYYSNPPAPTNVQSAMICSGDIIPVLSVSSEPGISINWYDSEFPDGNLLDSSTNSFKPEIDGNAPGSYNYFAESVITSASGQTCNSVTRTPVSLIVHARPQPPSSPQNQSICLGDNVPALSVIAPSIVNSGALSVHVNWYDNSGVLLLDNSTIFSPTFSDIDTGTFMYFTEAVYDYGELSCNSLSNSEVTLVINENPKAEAIIDRDTICDNESTFIRAIASEGSGFYEYNWNIPMSDSKEVEIKPSDSQSYTVTVTDSMTKCYDTDFVSIVVNKAPDSDFFERSTVINQELTVGTLFELISNESIDIEGGAAISDYEWTFSEELKIYTTDGDSTITNSWFEKNVQFPIFNDSILEVTLKVTDFNECMDEKSKRLQFESSDNCQIKRADLQAQSLFCVDQEFSYVFEYVSSISQVKLDELTWIFPPGSGGRLVSMDPVSGIVSGTTFVAKFSFINPGEWRVGVKIRETPLPLGCERTDDFVVDFNILEQGDIGIPPTLDTTTFCDTDDKVLLFEDLVPNNGLFRYRLTNDSTGKILIKNVEYTNGQVAIPLDSVGVGPVCLLIESVSNINGLCETSNFELDYKYEIIACGASEKLDGIEIDEFSKELLEKCINECISSSDFDKLTFTYNDLPISDSFDVFYIFSELMSFDNKDIDLNENNIFESKSTIRKDDFTFCTDSLQTSKNYYLYAAVSPPGLPSFIRVSSSPLRVKVYPKPSLQIKLLDEDSLFCYNKKDILLRADSLESSFDLSWRDSQYITWSPDSLTTDANGDILADSMYVELTEENNIFEVIWTYGFEGTTHECNEISSTALQNNGLYTLKNDTAFIQWWPGNILASSFKLDTISRYDYEWGKTVAGIEKKVDGENGNWYYVLSKDEASDIDTLGIPHRNGKKVDYWVDVMRNSQDSAQCPLRLYYTGDGFVPSRERNDNKQTDGLIIYPNPNNGSFTIELPDNYRYINKIIITDIFGHAFHKIPYANETGSLHIEMTSYSPGVYFCTVVYNNGTKAVQKFIIH